MPELVAKRVPPNRVSALLRPLAGARPNGVELDHHDERFRTVLGEIDKLSSMSSDPDWSRVITCAEALLSHKTKDLRIAAALARAWWEGKGGEANLVHGLRLVVGLARDFWPDLHPGPPERPERLDALDLFALWLDERWSHAALSLPVPDRAAVAEALAELCTLVGERLGDAAPELSALRRLADALQRSLPTSEPDPEPTPQPAPAPASTPTSEAPPAASRPAAPPPDASPPPRDADDALAFLRGLRDRLLECASLLRSVDPAAPLAYRLARQTAWQHLDDLETTGGRLPWPPPHRRHIDTLERLARAQQWAELLDVCETTLPALPLWLDLQRHAANALCQLGHTAARQTLDHELRGLLLRLPALPDLRFNDGTPVAAPDTRTWLEGLTSVGGTAAAAARPTDLAGLQAAAERAPSGRERFLLRHDLARACLAAGRADVAADLLAALRDEAHHHHLATWEPELLVACLSELVGCARTLGDETRVRLGIHHALAELSALHPPVALALGRDPLHARP